MPVASDPALKLAVQTRYLQGYKPHQIAAELGVKPQTIKTWAARGGWLHAVASVNAKAESTIAEAKGEAIEQALENHGNASRRGLAALLARSVKVIDTMTLTSPKHALQVNQALEPLVRNAKTVFGWSDSTQAPAVRIAIMSQTTLVSTSPTSAFSLQPSALPSPPAIDVTSEAVPCVEEKELLNPAEPNRPDDT